MKNGHPLMTIKNNKKNECTSKALEITLVRKSSTKKNFFF